jgi:hypothetical protein
MEHVSEALSALVESDAEPLSDDAREAIREGLCHEQEGPQDDDGEWEPPLGWPGVEPIL